MTFFHAAILGILQGITEMLPVSSSTHLMIFSQLQGLPNQRHSFDIFLNIGSLLAVIVFYFPQILDLIKGGFDILLNKKSKNRTLAVTVIVANIPTIIVFGIAELFFDIDFTSPFLISVSLIVFAFVMLYCDYFTNNSCDNLKNPNDSFKTISDKSSHFSSNSFSLSAISRKDAIFAGIAQICAIFPGVSRLGVCFSLMRFLKYSRLDSFHFSMILSVIPVTGACFIKTVKIFTGNIIIENWNLVLLGSICSFIFGLISLHFMNYFLKKHSMLCFVIYRILFGLFILVK